MSSLLASLAAGVLFGVALAAPPGPMNAVIAEESVVRGWDAGVRAGVGAMLADVLFCVLALAGVAAVVERHGTVQDALFLVGGFLMLAFAVDAARSATAESGFTAAGGRERTTTGFRKAFALSVTNPYQIAFWLTAGVGLVRPGTLDVAVHLPAGLADAVGSFVVETGSPALLGGFFGGIAVWILAYPAALSATGRRIDAFAPLVAAASAFVLGGFGLLFCWVGATALL